MSLSPEVRRGGGLPFGQVVSQWVCDPRYTTNLRTLYTILVTYADIGARDTAKGRPYRPELAAQLGVSVKTLDRTLLEGECAGMLRIERRTDPSNPKLNDSSVYHLRDAEFWRGEWTDPLAPGQTATEVATAVVAARVEAKRKAGITPKGGRRKAKPEARAGVASPVTPPQTEGSGVTYDARGSDTGDARVASSVTPNVFTPVFIPGRDPSLSSSSPVAPVPVSALVPDGRGNSAPPKMTSTQSADAELPEQRGGSTQAAAGGRIVAAYTVALGRPVLNGTRAEIERQAVDLLTQGFPEAWLCDRARELADRGWTDLAKHAERSPVKPPTHNFAARNGLPAWCGECGGKDHNGVVLNPAAQFNPRLRTENGAADGEKCPRCHPSMVPVGSA
ncbi:hypothetical protein ACFYWN_37605 [Streptomyces sp. NPDC002917]|uniref:hypothetical protein n=1 Tax=Streptomyces sp. NPDC002917 TaxID=3364671 RepID=UPI0036B029CC